MGLIVQKFGGSSVATPDRIRNVARIITDTYKKGNQVVVVLSAMGDTTDDLIALAKEINPNGSRREMDMLLSTGEQISISLLAGRVQHQLHLRQRPHQAAEQGSHRTGTGPAPDRAAGRIPGCEQL